MCMHDVSHASTPPQPCLVIDDAPGVWHHTVVVPCKSMVASPGSPKAIAQDLGISLPACLQRFLDIIGC